MMDTPSMSAVSARRSVGSPVRIRTRLPRSRAVGGSFRISLTYDAPTGTGKSTAHTDTYHGHFAKLVPDEQVVAVTLVNLPSGHRAALRRRRLGASRWPMIRSARNRYLSLMIRR